MHKTIFVVGSGPSLNEADLTLAVGSFRTLVTNRTYAMLSKVTKRQAYGHIVYGCDYAFWHEFYSQVISSFEPCSLPELWTSSFRAAVEFRNLKYVHRSFNDNSFNHVYEQDSLCTDKGVIYTGHNSAYQGVGLAYQMGYRRIALLGVDCQHTYGKIHHHEDYKGESFNNPDTYLCNAWAKVFDKLGREAKKYSLSIVNTTRETAITEIERVALEDYVHS